MKAVHFGAGNIGRGFIGEILFDNQFHITFIDIDEIIISKLNQYGSFEIEYADETHERKRISNVDGILSKKSHKVIEAIVDASIITTAIGPQVIPHIAHIIANGLKERMEKGNQSKLDLIACENMIGGSQFLKQEVYKHLNEIEMIFADANIGFPNAAVDRIVPLQELDERLAVVVEPFKEWIIDESQMKNPSIRLLGVQYVPDLSPYVERKLFTANTGHASVGYFGAYKKHQTVYEALLDQEILEHLQQVIEETGNLLIHKWNLDPIQQEQYRKKVIKRFQNPYLSDNITRISRTPIRKLSYDERFVRPIRELKGCGLNYSYLIKTVGLTLNYYDISDAESVKLQEMLENNELRTVVQQITSLKDEELITEICTVYNKIKNNGGM